MLKYGDCIKTWKFQPHLLITYYILFYYTTLIIMYYFFFIPKSLTFAPTRDKPAVSF